MNNIIAGWPNDTSPEHKKLKNVITAQRGKIYLCDQKNVRQDLIVHEEIHLKQQGDNYDDWLKRYQTDKEFRIAQEVEAYRGQLKYIEKIRGHADMLSATVFFAKFLSSDVYGNVITADEAIKKLQL